MNILQDLFTAILNMSITASFVAIGVILVRLLLKKVPKLFSYILWTPVLFRVICPFSFASVFSFLRLINLNAQQGRGVEKFVPQNTELMQTPAIQSGIDSIDNAANTSLPQDILAASVNPMHIWMTVLSLIWIVGVIALLFYSVVSYMKIKGKLQTATLVKDNVFETDAVGTAFVCGFIRPKIYVPVNVGDADLSYILAHERTHIRRRDYLIKPLAFLALILHWFNPIMWLSFALMSRDMEMSCDESVLRRLGDGAKSGYSGLLLALSVKRNRLLAVNPLAFCESHVKLRIKNVLNYKKPAFWVIITAAVTVIVAAIGLLANPLDTDINKNGINYGQIKTGTNGNTDDYDYDATDPVEVVRADYMSWLKKDYTISMYVINAEVDEAETQRQLERYKGSELAENRGWTDAYLDQHFIVVKVIYECEIDHTKTYMSDGLLEGYVFLTRDPESGIWTIVDRTSPSDILVKDEIEITKLVEENLAVIMSSPLQSSATGAYIKAHQKEYDMIVSMGEKALPYLIGILDGGAKGLRGNIVMLLCEDIVKNLNENQGSGPETEKLIKEALDSIDKRNALMGYTSSRKDIEPMPELTEEEVAAAYAVVEEYYRAVAAKDAEAILATMYPRENRENNIRGNVSLKRTLLTIDYDSQDSMRRSYKPGGKAIAAENIIVFKVSFKIEYPLKDGGPWKEDIYNNWSMILIRDNKNSPWLIYDQGY